MPSTGGMETARVISTGPRRPSPSSMLAPLPAPVSDFGGGLLTRRLPALTVVVASQALAAVALGAVVLGTGAWREAGPQLWFAVAAGLVGPVAVLSFYKPSGSAR